jgi:hypothetical protein
MPRLWAAFCPIWCMYVNRPGQLSTEGHPKITQLHRPTRLGPRTAVPTSRGFSMYLGAPTRCWPSSPVTRAQKAPEWCVSSWQAASVGKTTAAVITRVQPQSDMKQHMSRLTLPESVLVLKSRTVNSGYAIMVVCCSESRGTHTHTVRTILVLKWRYMQEILLELKCYGSNPKYVRSPQRLVRKAKGRDQTLISGIPITQRNATRIPATLGAKSLQTASVYMQHIVRKPGDA